MAIPTLALFDLARLIRAAAIAFLVLLAVPVPIAEAARAYETVISADGTPIAVTTEGPADAPAIVLIHGIGQSSLSWSAQFDSELTRNYRLVAFDLRGHGASGKPWAEGAYGETRWAEDVSAVLAATGVQRPLVIAWSYGSYVISDYIRMEGVSQLSGVIFVGATAGIANPPQDSAMAARMEAFQRMRQAQTSPDLAAQIEGSRMSSGYLFVGHVDEQIRQRSFEASLMLPAYARRQMLARRFDSQGVETLLEGLPTMFLGGSADGSYSGDVPRQLRRALPRAEVLLYEGIGHSPFLEAPARFNADVERFARRVFVKNGEPERR